MDQDRAPLAQHHPTQTMTTPEGEHVEIDAKMVPLIAALWRAGYVTDMCCQDTGQYMREGSPPEPPHDREGAASRMMGRAWVRLPDEHACRLTAAVKTAGLDREWSIFAETRREGWTSVTFPKEQIPALAEFLRA